jgi:Tfp pilus assembly protein PilO
MKTKPIMILAVTAILIGAISFLAIKPVVVSLWSAWKDLERAKEDLSQVEEKKKILEELKKNPHLVNVGQIASKYIPTDKESGELVIELTAMASANNLKVEETSMVETKPSSQTSEETTPEANKNKTPTPQPSASQTSSSGAKEVAFTMKLSGTFTDFLNFLRDVDSSSRLISLKTLSLQMTATAEQSTFTAQIGGAAFYKNDVSLANTLDNIRVSDETIKKFLNLKTYGAPINLPAESGFGRTNPFENY